MNPPEVIYIPEGAFLMGTSDGQIEYLVIEEAWAEAWFNQRLFQVEQPQHKVVLPAYGIARLPVTNAEYYQFVYDTGYRVPRDWIGFRYPLEEDRHPVAGVAKADALAYCRWLSQKTGLAFRLPTEAEWERAARGMGARIYPWGNDFDPWRCNTVESNKRGTTPVGEYSAAGDSPFGLADMAGNVWEWTSSWLEPYPYRPEKQDANPQAGARCVVRGGAWYYSRALARCSAREGVMETYLSPALGFRLACTP
jgi:formylglycine-generating enzyme required for sulfatase activity